VLSHRPVTEKQISKESGLGRSLHRDMGISELVIQDVSALLRYV
jgi:hypothetical protein